MKFTSLVRELETAGTLTQSKVFLVLCFFLFRPIIYFDFSLFVLNFPLKNHMKHIGISPSFFIFSVS